jgi:hypothetical protein
MRYIVYISVILAAMLVAKIATPPRGATASHNEANDTINALQLEQTNNAKALPRQEIPDEVYR